MKNVIQILSILFLASCGSNDNPTSSSQGKGQITYKATLYDQYDNILKDQSGIVGQIYNENKLIQTVLSDASGLISFNNIEMGIYNFKYFKPGYTAYYVNSDTISIYNLQYIGIGKFSLLNYPSQFGSKDFFDTTYLAIPNVNYEVVKNKVATQVYIKDTTIYDSITNHKTKIGIYGSGIVEKWVLKFHADFPKILPNPTFNKRIKFSINANRGSRYDTFDKSFPYNQTSYDWEYESPNHFVFDSLGNNITTKTANSGFTYGVIESDSLTVQLSNTIDYTNGSFNTKKYIIYSPKISVKLNY